jgi:predicted DNA-binding transcriptional regulator AlpA
MYYLAHGGNTMRKHQDKTKRTLIGTLEVAARLNCHQISIPRYVKTKKGFPKPGKLCGKNVWYEDAIDEFIAAQMAAAE